jgi:arginyl-tRNA synthetase
VSIYLELHETIKKEIRAALERAKAKGSLEFSSMPPFVLEKPREAQHGDLATNAAMLMAKEARKSPRDIARILTDEIRTEGTWIDQIEIAGAGFINFLLKKDWLFGVLPEILKAGDTYGSVNIGKGEKVLVEFVSANPTGLPHMGNARGAALGDSVASLLTLAGYDVDREFYINDAGNQIVNLANSLEARYLEALGLDFDRSMIVYEGQDLVDKVQAIASEVGDGYVSLEVSDRRKVLTERVVGETVSDIRRTLESFGVRFDRWFSEKTLYESGKVQETLNLLTEKGWTYEKDGAVWLKASLWGDEKDEVLVRANGIPTYFAADIAYHGDKFARGYTRLVNIWGADHHGHVARMKGAMEGLGYDGDQLEVILMQLVFLLENDEIKKQSKRLGQFVTLQELLDEVGIDAARLFFMMRDPDSAVEFDLELAKKELNENPVFYVQFAHARLCGVMQKAAERFGEGIDADILAGREIFPGGDVLVGQDEAGQFIAGRVSEGTERGLSLKQKSLNQKWDLLSQPEEMAMIQKLAELPQEVMVATNTLQPHRLAHYAMDLASLFHSFIEAQRVLVEDEGLRGARLGLLRGTRQVLVSVLKILGVSAPVRM